MTRQRPDGLRKRCTCARRSWAKCPHPWHFDFKHAEERYRFSLDRHIGRLVRAADGTWTRDRTSLGKPITDKTSAEKERDRLKVAIRDGTLHELDKPQRDTLTLAQLFATYRAQYLTVHRAGTIKTTDYMIGAILRRELQRSDGEGRAFGEWLVADISTDTIEQYRRAARATGSSGRHHLELLRGLFNWATSNRRKLAADNPFLDGSQAAVKVGKSTARTRRLHAGERERLLAACGPHLWAIVQAALETGMRRGEILSLQWWQVRFEPKAEIFLPAAKTKTRADRKIPISSTLKAILDMRQTGPDGEKHPPAAFVFGNEAGEPVKNVKHAWQRAVLVAHGTKPRHVTRTAAGKKKERIIVRTALLTRECQQQLQAIDLHFHDLRREAGSRWLDGGVPLHRVQAWLGHTNISQTSTYLRADGADDDEAMRRFEARVTRCDTDSETGAQNGAQDATNENAKTLNSSGIH